MLQYYRPRACGLKMAALACGLVLMVGAGNAFGANLNSDPPTGAVVNGVLTLDTADKWNLEDNSTPGSLEIGTGKRFTTVNVYNNWRAKDVTINLQNGGTLNLVNNSDSDGAGINTVNAVGTADLKFNLVMTGGTLNMAATGDANARLAQFSSVDLTGGTVNISGRYANNWLEASVLYGDIESYSHFSIGGAATVNLGDYGTIASYWDAPGYSLDITGGTINMNGSAATTAGIIRASSGSTREENSDTTYAILNFSGGAINVASGKHGVILSRKTNMTGGVIDVKGKLVVAGSAGAGTDITAGVTAATLKRWGDFNINGGKIENSGVIDFVTGNMTLNARGGELTGNLNLASSAGTTAGTTYSKNLHVLAGGSFLIGGNLDIASGATFDNKGSLTVAGKTTVAALTLASGSSTRFAGGLAASGNLTVEANATAAFGADSTVTGNAIFKSRSIFGIDAANKLSVTGSATIESGALVQVSNIDPISAVGRTILEAKSITGQFAANGKSLYDVETVGNVVRITGTNSVGDVLARNDIVTGNSMSAGAMLSAIMYDETVEADPALRGKLNNAVNKITSLVASNKPHEARVATAQLFGEHALAGSSATHATAQAFTGNTANRQIQIRANRAATALAPVASDGAYAALRSSTRSSSVRSASASRSAPSSFDPNRFWAAGFGAFARQSDRGGSFGYKYNAGGFILGYDREIGAFVFGVSSAYSGGRVKNNEGLTATDVDTFNIGLYASYNHPTGFFVDGNSGFGLAWNDTATTDAVFGGRRDGSYRNTSFQLGATTGYVFSLPAETRIIPSFGLQWTHVHQQGWAEVPSTYTQLANWFAGSNDDYLTLPLQVRANKTFRLGGDASITPELRAAWVLEALDPRASVRMGYVGSSASTTIHGLSSGRSRGIIGAGVKATFARRFDAFVDYNLEFRNRYTNHNIMAGVGVSF